LRLGEELQELRQANTSLREAARQLYEENASLREENTVLRSKRPAAVATEPGPKWGQRAVAAPVRGQGALQPVPTPVKANNAGCVPHVEQRALEIANAIKGGNNSVLSKCTEEQRKELVAAMMKAGLFDQLPPSRGDTTNQEQGRLEAASTSVLKPIKGTVASSANRAGSYSAQKPIYVEEPVSKHAPAPTVKAPAVLVEEAAPVSEQTTSKASTRHQTSGSSKSVGSAAQGGTAKQMTALSPLSPVPEHDRRIQELAQAVRQGDKKALSKYSPDQRKDIIADMLKAGLFQGVSPPTDGGVTGIDIIAFSEASGNEHESSHEDFVRNALQDLSTIDQPNPRTNGIVVVEGDHAQAEEGSRYVRELQVRAALQNLTQARL